MAISGALTSSQGFCPSVESKREREREKGIYILSSHAGPTTMADVPRFNSGGQRATDDVVMLKALNEQANG